MSSAGNEETPTKRGRGRPRLEIDDDAVAETVAQLFVEGGLDAVTMTEAAERLSVSRATLYRTVPTREDLLGILFERSTRELTEDARTLLGRVHQPRERLEGLVRLQVDAAIRMRQYMPVFFGGGDLPEDVVARWHGWSREFERLWVEAVSEAMRTGDLAQSDPVVTARLILGMCIWICRWYRPDGRFSQDVITESAIRFLWGPTSVSNHPPASRTHRTEQRP